MADGRITIDTGLDTSGFDKGSEKIKTGLMQLMQTFARMNGDLQTKVPLKVDPNQIINKDVLDKHLKDIESESVRILGNLNKLAANDSRGLFNNADLEKQRQALEKSKDDITMLIQKMGQLSVVRLYNPQIAKLDEEIEEARKNVERWQNEYNRLYARIQSGAGTDKDQRNLKLTADDLRLATEECDALIQKQERLVQAMKRVGESDADFQKIRQTIIDLARANDTLASSYYKSKDAVKTKEGDADRRARMAEKEAMINQVMQERIAKQEREAQEQAAAAEERHAAMAAALSNALHALGDTLKLVASAAFSLVKNAVSATAAALAKWASAVAKAPFQLAEAGARTLGSAFSRLRGEIATAGHAIQSIGHGIKSAVTGFGSLLSKLSLFSKQGAGVGDVATDMVRKLTSLKRMLITRVKRMFISSVFKDMQAAIDALANKSKTFNASMTSMQNAAKGLSSNLAVSFSNLVNAVAPVITQIINWITTLITYLNGFFAMLSGATSIMTAKKATDSYGKSAGGASKKAKELKKQIMGFDEINNLTEDKNDSGGGGGGGAKAPQYEKKLLSELLPEDLRLWMQKIKDAIAAEEWEMVGVLFADGVNYVLEKIDNAISEFRKIGTKWADIVARVMNGFVAGFDFTLLGKTIADGLNAIIAIENTFLRRFNFFALGAGLGQTINKMFEDIEWDEVGRNFGLKIMAINRLFNGFLHTFKANAAGAKLGTALGAMFDEIKWTGPGGIADTLSTGANAIIEALDGLFTEFEKDGEERRQVFSDALYEAVKGIRWGDFIRTLHLGFRIISLWLTTAFAGLTEGIKDSIPDIVSAINEIITEDSFSEVTSNIGTGVQNLLDAFKQIVDPENGIDFVGIGEKVGEGINSFIAKVDFGDVVLAVGNGFAGLQTAFTTGVATIDFVAIAVDLVNGINKLVTQNSFKYVWHNVTTGVNNIIKAFNELVGGEGSATGGIKFDEIRKTITDSVNTIITETDFDTAVAAVGTGIAKIFAEFSQLLADVKWTVVAAKFATGLNKFVHSDQINWGKIGKDLGTALKEQIEALATFLDTVDWHQIGEDIGQFMANIPWGDIAKAMWNLFKGALKAAFNLVDGFTEAIAGHDKNWNLGSFGTRVGEEVQKLAPMMGNEGSEAARNLFDGFVNSVDENTKPTMEQTRTAAVLVAEGYADGIFEAAPDVYNAANRMLYEILNSRTIADLKANFANYGIEISESFADALGVQSKDNIMTAFELLAMGVDEATIQALDITNIDAVLKAYMEDTGKDLNTVATELATNAGTAIGEIIPSAVAHGLREAGPELDKAAKETADVANQIDNQSDVKESAKETGGNVVSGVTEALNEGKPAVEESSNALVETMETAFDKLPESEKTKAAALLEAVNMAIIAGTPEAEASMQTAANAIIQKAEQILSDGAGKKIGSTFLSGVTAGIKSQIVGIYNTMVPVGTAISMGIVRGIRSSQSAVTVAAHNAAIAAYNAAMRAINAHSPSKLFANVGKFSMLGWAKGEDDNADAVINSIAQTTAAMEKEAEDTDIRFIDNTMLTGIDAAVDKMEEIAAVFSRVADMIASVGELPVPALAEGTVIPYQTKIDTASLDLSGVQAQMPSNALTPDNSYEVLYRAFADALRDSSGDRPIELYLNGTRVMDWIERQTRQNDRARGV